MNRTASVVTTVAVVVPASDEAETIGLALDAIVVAATHVDVPCVIVVVDDASTDATVAIARRSLARHPGVSLVVSVDAGRASRARAVGASLVASAAGVDDPACVWLLSTDADSVVADDWIARHLVHARAGHTAVAGTVDLFDDEEGRRIRPAWIVEYGASITSERTHSHVHAANLGVRLDAFLDVGGFGDRERAEDIDLWTRLRAAGHRPVADADIVVATSARPIGRVELGFAGALRRLYA